MKRLSVLFAIAFCLGAVRANAQSYGPNVITGGSVSCSDTYYAPPYYLCGYNVDGNDSTNWHSDNIPNPHWVKYDLGQGNAKVIAKLHVNIRNDGAGLQLKGWKLEGSNDDSTYVIIATGTTVNAVTGYQDFTFTNVNPYRYYKFSSTGDTWNTNYPQYMSLFEFQAMECLNCTSTPPPGAKPGELYGTSLFSDPNLIAYYRLEDNQDSKGAYPLTDDTAGGTPTFQGGAFGLASDTGSVWAANMGKYNDSLCISTETTPVTLYAQVKINSFPPNSSAAYDGDFVNVPTCAHNVEYTLGAGYFNAAGQYDSTRLTIFGNRAQSGVHDERVIYPINLVPGHYYGVIFTWDGAGTEKLYLQQTTGGPYTLVASLSGQSTATGNGAFERGLGINGSWRTGGIMQAGVGGAVDDFAVFNRAFVQADVDVLSGQAPPPNPSLNGLYTFFNVSLTTPPASDCATQQDVGKTILTDVGGIRALYSCFAVGWKLLIF